MELNKLEGDVITMKTIKQVTNFAFAITLAIAMVVTSASAFWSGDRVRNYDWSSMATIKSGSSGGTVKGCQQFLNCESYSVGDVDGAFGSKTTSAVKKYQSAHNLTADGIVGKNTWASMNDNLSYYDTGSVNYSYCTTHSTFGDDRFKHQYASSSSQGAIGSWWVMTDSEFVKICS